MRNSQDFQFGLEFGVILPDMKQSGREVSPLFRSVLWALTDSNRRPSACKADALNQRS